MLKKNTHYRHCIIYLACYNLAMAFALSLAHQCLFAFFLPLSASWGTCVVVGIHVPGSSLVSSLDSLILPDCDTVRSNFPAPIFKYAQTKQVGW